MKRDYPEVLGSLVEMTNAKVCVEVGVATGTSAVGICEALTKTKGHLYGFDVWKKHGLKNQFRQLGSKDIVKARLTKMGLKNFTLTAIDTINDRTNFEIKLDELLLGKKINFGFIDGCHSYIGIKNDFEVIYPRLSYDGVVVFHDTVHIDGCREFVFDLRTKYFDGTYDIVDFPYGAWDRNCGVSVLVKRSFPLMDKAIIQICGSPSDPDTIEKNERKWLKEEIDKYKNNIKFPVQMTEDDLHPNIQEKRLRFTGRKRNLE